MEESQKYIKDFYFFEKFFLNKNFKLWKRISQGFTEPLIFLYLPFVLFPTKIIPQRFREKFLFLKYKTDLIIVRKNMPKIFNNKSFTFFDYNFNSLFYKTENTEDIERIFLFLNLILSIFIKDQYTLKDLLINKQKPIILDCGANMGFVSLFARKIVENCEIYAFEPLLKNYEIMKTILEENKVKNIFPFNLALGDENKNVTLLSSKRGVNDSAKIKNEKEESDYQKYPIKELIKMITIDNFVFNIKKLPKVDFIKMDTEGYERQIIKGATQTIKKFKPIIACSGYHLPDDEKIIPEMVLDINPDYSFKMINRGEKVLIFY